MNSGAGLLLIMGGLLLLYAVITGKFGVIESAFYQLFEIQQPADTTTPTGTGSADTKKADKAASDVLSSPNIGSNLITLPQIFIQDYTKQS